MSFATRFPGFQLRLTKWGGVFLVLSLVLGFAAVNTGNNALMATLGLALASYAISGTWSRQVLARIEVAARLPQEIFADREATVELEISNSSSFFTAYGVVVRDSGGRRLTMLPWLGVGATRTLQVQARFGERGWTELGSWRVEVLLPLGFFLKSKAILGDRRLLVFPRLLRSTGAAASTGGDSRELEQWRKRGREGEVTQLRDFRDGDERRQIHWKQTARQQRLIAVERQQPSDTPVVFVLDNRVADPHDAGSLRAFEVLLSEVATAVVRRLQSGGSVGVVVGAESAGPTDQRRQLCALMRPLAEAQLRSRAGRPPARVGSGSVRAVQLQVEP